MTASYLQSTELDALLKESGLVVLDYTASWCGPCRIISPYIDKLAEEYAGRAQVFKVDLDQNKENAKKFKIKSIPAVLYFKDGELVEHLTGKASYETFSETLEKYL